MNTQEYEALVEEEPPLVDIDDPPFLRWSYWTALINPNIAVQAAGVNMDALGINFLRRLLYATIQAATHPNLWPYSLGYRPVEDIKRLDVPEFRIEQGSRMHRIHAQFELGMAHRIPREYNTFTNVPEQEGNPHNYERREAHQHGADSKYVEAALRSFVWTFMQELFTQSLDRGDAGAGALASWIGGHQLPRPLVRLSDQTERSRRVNYNLKEDGEEFGVASKGGRLPDTYPPLTEGQRTRWTQRLREEGNKVERLYARARLGPFPRAYRVQE